MKFFIHGTSRNLYKKYVPRQNRFALKAFSKSRPVISAGGRYNSLIVTIYREIVRYDIDSGSIPSSGEVMYWILGFLHCRFYRNTESYVGIQIPNRAVCRWWYNNERTFWLGT